MKTSPKDFFFHLGVVIALYVGAGALINLAFVIIDAAFPNQLYYGNYYTSPLSWPVAILIIVFPVYILLSWLLNKDYRLMPEKRTLGIRKWLLYLTLFVSGGVIAGDLVTLIYRFLGGEIITMGFILKVIAIFIIAAGIFGYYISDLRDKTNARKNRMYAIISGVAILTLIIWGFVIFGSPMKQRMLRLDSQKVSDLQNIQWQITNYWQQKQVLPQVLDNINDPISGYTVPRDQDTGESYEYRIAGERKFELCAKFNIESTANNRNTNYAEPALFPEKPGMNQNENWLHAAGRSCFERTIDPQLYPPRKI